MIAGGHERLQGDEVRLVLPADAPYGRLARVAAVGLARRLGLSYRGIEDLGLAVDEAVILVLHLVGADDRSSVEVLLDVRADGLSVRVSALGPRPEEHGLDLDAPTPTDEEDRVAPDERFGDLVTGAVSDWTVDVAERSVTLWVRGG